MDGITELFPELDAFPTAEAVELEGYAHAADQGAEVPAAEGAGAEVPVAEGAGAEALATERAEAQTPAALALSAGREINIHSCEGEIGRMDITDLLTMTNGVSTSSTSYGIVNCYNRQWCGRRLPLIDGTLDAHNTRNAFERAAQVQELTGERWVVVSGRPGDHHISVMEARQLQVGGAPSITLIPPLYPLRTLF